MGIGRISLNRPPGPRARAAHVHADITTDDGQRISLHADGVALLQPGSPVAGLRENMTLFTSSEAYAWVNGLQVWATGTVDLAERLVRIKGYSA